MLITVVILTIILAAFIGVFELRTIRRDRRARQGLTMSAERYKRDMWRNHDYRGGGTPT